MVIGLFGEDRDVRHEGEGRREILELEAAVDTVALGIMLPFLQILQGDGAFAFVKPSDRHARLLLARLRASPYVAGMGDPRQTAEVRAAGLACLRGGRLLFEGLDLHLGAGQAALVSGPNGIGKSSLLRVIAGLIAPAAGSVAVHGGIALAADAAGLDERLSVADALGFWARIDGADALDPAMAAMGIAHLARVPVRMLSTGQRKRAVLARTIASGARVWLLDEPANGLDAAALDGLGAMMEGHRASGGIVIAATHQPIGLIDPIAVTL